MSNRKWQYQIRWRSIQTTSYIFNRKFCLYCFEIQNYCIDCFFLSQKYFLSQDIVVSEMRLCSVYAETYSLPVAFFAFFNSLVCWSLSCASFMAVFSVWEFDRDLNMLLEFNKFGIGGGGGGGGGMDSLIVIASIESIFALSLIVAFSIRNSSSLFSARILDISSSLSRSLIWSFKDSTSALILSSKSLSRLFFFFVIGFIEILVYDFLFTWNVKQRKLVISFSKSCEANRGIWESLIFSPKVTTLK